VRFEPAHVSRPPRSRKLHRLVTRSILSAAESCAAFVRWPVHSKAWGRRLAVATVAFVGCNKPSGDPREVSEPQREPVAVSVAPVERGAVQRTVVATGSLFGEEQTTIAAKVSGRIDAIFHDVGDALLPGEPLARVEPIDYELALAERRRAFEQALAQLGLEALPEQEFSVDELPTVERARLQAENAAARHERGALLHQRIPPAMSDQDYADLATAWEVAQADHRLAQLNAKAQLAAARTLKAQLDSAAQRLSDTLHVVPRGMVHGAANGGAAGTSVQYVVTARHVSVGDFVPIGAPMFELVDPDPLKLRVRIPEREVARVKVGQVARLKVEAYEEDFPGRVARINPSVDVQTRTFEVEITVPNASGALRSGSFAKAEIETEYEEGVVLVPPTAIRTFAGVHKVFVVEDGKALERIVTLGSTVGERIEIVRGIAGDDVLIPAPPPGLTGGTPVHVEPVQGEAP
jgi:multidrug efflux pump subunit AcrA (membrane-fusion protein)